MSVNQKRVVVRVEQPEHMNLMGLLMRGLLESTLGTSRGSAIARKLRGEVRVMAGTMGVTLCFGDGEVVLKETGSGRPRATVRGEMKPLLEIVSGGALIAPVLTRKVKVSGNLLLLLRLLPLIRTPGQK